MQLTYNGTKLNWKGVGVWDASSGMPGYQEPKYQNLSDKGPIPEGTYSVPLRIGGNATVRTYRTQGGNLTEAYLDRRSEIQSLQCIQDPTSDGVLLFQNWGSNRVRLQKLKLTHANTRHRDGFYLHDSTKGHSHGCVEVGTGFFDTLRDFATTHQGKVKSLVLTVKYEGNTTKGATQTGIAVVVKCS